MTSSSTASRVVPGMGDAIGRRQLAARIHQKDDVRGALERHPRLLENLRGNVLLVIGHDTTGIDHFEATAVELGNPVNAVACDAGLIAHNGASLSGDAVE